MQPHVPIALSRLTQWRQRIDKKGAALLLAVTVEATRAAGLTKRPSLDKLIIDTTIVPKAIGHSMGRALLERSRQHMDKFAQGIWLA